MRKIVACILAFCTLLFSMMLSFSAAFAEEEFIVPDHINETIDRYKEAIDENDLDIQFEDWYWEPDFLARKSDGDLGTYEVVFYNLSAQRVFIMYNENTYGQAEQSLNIFFLSSISGDFREKFIALTIVVIEPSLSFSQAESIAQKMLSSYTGKGHSEAVPVGDCMLTLNNDLEDTSSLYVTYNSEINVVTDKSQYGQLSFDDIRSMQHSGEKIFVTGTVEQQRKKFADTSDQAEYVIFASGRHRYTAYFFYPHMPVQFDLGQEYTFYGYVNGEQEDGFASMVIDFYEKSE